MTEKRSKPRRQEDDPQSPPAADPTAGDDSIEILEVVGVEEDGSRAERSQPSPTLPGPPEEDTGDSEIPYSRRELYEMLLRKQADYENARKRLDREREETRRRVWADLLGRLLPILDNFDRALAESGSASPEAFREGVALTVQQMRDLLTREGLEEISAPGEPFDPHLHEAVETRAVEGFEEGIVLEELRKGYRFQGQLLRPALVRVSAKGGRKPSGGEA